MTSIADPNCLMGGHCRGRFLFIVIWDVCHGIISQAGYLPSWQSFALLACGWALATDRHTITTYVWLTGATTVKHFSRFFLFLVVPFTPNDGSFGALSSARQPLVPEGAVLQVAFDDTTKKKAGRHIEGLDRYRNGAGSARQAYRTLRGVNVVFAIMAYPSALARPQPQRPGWLELYLKPAQALKLNVPYRSRSQLAHHMLSLSPSSCLTSPP